MRKTAILVTTAALAVGTAAPAAIAETPANVEIAAKPKKKNWNLNKDKKGKRIAPSNVGAAGWFQKTTKGRYKFHVNLSYKNGKKGTKAEIMFSFVHMGDPTYVKKFVVTKKGKVTWVLPGSWMRGQIWAQKSILKKGKFYPSKRIQIK